MAEHDHRPFQALSRVERTALVVGAARDHDEDDFAFWRTAGDELRGRTLYRLLLQGRAIAHAAPNAIAPLEDRQRLILIPGAMFILTDDE